MTLYLIPVNLIFNFRRQKIPKGTVFDFKIVCTYGKNKSSGLKLMKKIYEVYNSENEMEHLAAVVYQWNRGTKPFPLTVAPHGNQRNLNSVYG